MRLSTTRILTALAILGLGASPAFAALTGYLKIPDIPGESRNAVPGVEPDEIDVKAADDGRTEVALLAGPGVGLQHGVTIATGRAEKGDRPGVQQRRVAKVLKVFRH